MRATAKLLLLCLPLLAGCSDVQFERDLASGSSSAAPDGNVLLTIGFGGVVTGVTIHSVLITITRASGQIETIRPRISYPLEADFSVGIGDHATAEAEIEVGSAIGTMQMVDNDAFVSPPFTYDSKTCTIGTCTLTIDQLF